MVHEYVNKSVHVALYRGNMPFEAESRAPRKPEACDVAGDFQHPLLKLHHVFGDERQSLGPASLLRSIHVRPHHPVGHTGLIFQRRGPCRLAAGGEWWTTLREGG